MRKAAKNITGSIVDCWVIQNIKGAGERKQAWYRNNGILPFDEGGGPHGMLIVTQDNENGGISSQEIEELVKKIFS